MNITFLEVEAEDRALVSKNFPDARIKGNLSEDEIIAQCADTEILCVFIYSTISKRVLKKLPKLKMIITRSVGYDHIDLAAAKEKNIRVCHVPDYGAHVIAEHVFALLLTSLRHILPAEERTTKHNFDFRGLRGMALRGKTIGIIGTGKIGKKVARIASLGFLMKVVAFDAYPDETAALENHFQYVSMDGLLATSDIISLHCPLLPTTHHLLDESAVSQMKHGMTIINTSRGEVLKTSALIAGLKSGKIAHAALDVLEHEKQLAKNEEILSMENVIITPHIAFYADDSLQKMYAESFATLRRFLSGEGLLHEVLGC